MGLFRPGQNYDADGQLIAASSAGVNVAPLSAQATAEATRTIPTADALTASASVVRFGGTIGAIDDDPVLELDLLVFVPGALPRPMTIRPRVPLSQTPHFHDGATIAVTVSRTDPTIATIDGTRQ